MPTPHFDVQARPCAKHRPLTQARLHEVLFYDPATGIFTWRQRLAHRIQVGDRAGTPKSNGYWQIKIDNHLYHSHHLAWLYVYGIWPKVQMDHKDGNPGNNALANLREVTDIQNKQSILRPSRRSKSGLRGVWINTEGKWTAQITIRRVAKTLGVFASKEEAYAAYIQAKRQYHGYQE